MKTKTANSKKQNDFKTKGLKKLQVFICKWHAEGTSYAEGSLLLHLLEKYADRETAILASKYFAVDIDKDSQNAFAIFRGSKKIILMQQ